MENVEKQIVRIIENNSPELAAEEILRLLGVVGRSKQLPNRCSVCGRTDEERLTMTSMCGVSACPY